MLENYLKIDSRFLVHGIRKSSIDRLTTTSVSSKKLVVFGMLFQNNLSKLVCPQVGEPNCCIETRVEYLSFICF